MGQGTHQPRLLRDREAGWRARGNAPPYHSPWRLSKVRRANARVWFAARSCGPGYGAAR